MTPPRRGASWSGGATLLLAGLAAGCRPGLDGELIDVETSVSEVVPSVVLVDWVSDRPGRSYVEYGLDGALDLRTPVLEGSSEEHARALLGLKSGRTYSFRAVTEVEGGETLQSEIGTVDVPLAPPELPPFYVSEVNEAAMQEGGFVLTSILTQGPGWTIILDRDGDIVWYYSPGAPLGVPTSRLSLDKKSVMMLTNDFNLESDLGAVLRLSLDGEEQTRTRVENSHHDFTELPDGRIAWISAETRDVLIGTDTFNVVGDRILVRPEGSTDEPEELFNLFDDYAPVWPPCNHFDDTIYGLVGSKDWSHVNSLMYDDQEDDLLFVSKNFDARLRVDMTSGQLLEQIGGRYATREFAEGAVAWSHGHMSHSYPGGMLLFDNGYHHIPAVSRVVEYAWDGLEDSVHEVWSYEDPEDRFITLLGDARKQPNGNVLVAWTSAGFLTEITPGGEVVWRLDTVVGYNFGRLSWIDDIYGG